MQYRQQFIVSIVIALCGAIATPASAVLITQTVDHQVTSTPDGANQIFDLDIDQNGTTDLTFRSIIGDTTDPTFASFADIVPPFGTINGEVIDSFTGDGFPTVSLLHLGDVVSSASLFSGNNDDGNLSSQIFPDGPTGNYQNQSGYVGIQFSAADGTHYGFAHITVNDLLAPQDPLAVFISTVSYESVAGQPVTVSNVPEPKSLALLVVAFAVFALQIPRRLRIDILRRA
jgi:hypothetical protein